MGSGGEISGFRIGGGIICEDNSSPTIADNRIVGNSIGMGSGIYCYGGCSPLIIDNLIADNRSDTWGGGGILCNNSSSPTIMSNTITGNWGGDGGGIYCHNTSSPVIIGNAITGNRASKYGGGIFCQASSPSIFNNIIAENTAEWETSASHGGGIYVVAATPTIINNTITQNITGGPLAAGGGIYSLGEPSVIVRNCIIWGNTPNQVHGNLAMSYCWLAGAPLFADPENGDYHLKSKYGRWDPAANGGDGGWVFDDVTSPCIDAGDPASDVSNEPQPNGDIINIGAYGNTAEASLSSHVLTIGSTPVTGVNITGDRPGVTEYTTTCADQEVVSLTAPASTTTGEGITYNFVRWEGLADGVATIQVTVDSSHTVVAVYEVQTWTLSVESSPISGVAITGDKPGTTGYAANCEDQEIVNLTAPLTVTDATVRYDFVRWIVDGTDQPIGQTDVQITVDADIAATAVYAVRTHTLTVLSMPVSGVVVTGNRPGTTPYAATCDDQQLVTLTAPTILPAGSSRTNHFLYWAVDNEPQPYGKRELQLRMDSAHTAVAVYDWRLPGDVTGDCMVNVLDMIFVRNHARTACSE